MSVRKTIFWLHLIAGVVAGVVIFIMSVTGTLLMYQKQITAWADGATVTVPADTERISAAALIEKVKASEPGKPTAITVNSDPEKAVMVSYGREKTVFVNPYTGAVIGEGSKAVRALNRAAAASLVRKAGQGPAAVHSKAALRSTPPESRAARSRARLGARKALKLQ